MGNCHGFTEEKKCIAYLPPQNPVLREDVSNVSTSTDMHPRIHLAESRDSSSSLAYWRLRLIVLIPQSVRMEWWMAGRSHRAHTRRRLIRDTGGCSPATQWEPQSQQCMQVQLRKWVAHILSGFLEFFWSSSGVG